MKICLINPPVLVPKNWKGLTRVFQPLGLAYIAAVLEKNGYDVVILDALAEDWKSTHEYKGVKYNGMDFEKITEKIKEINPDIVGVTIVSTHKRSGLWTAEAVKKADKNIFVVAGGPHVCVRPKETLADENIDFICIGEGEYTMLELVKTLENGGSLKSIKGLGWKEGKKLIINEPRPLIENLDELPFPARHLLSMDIYFEAAKYMQTARASEKKWANIITSRGCPFNCIFCSINLSMGRVWRPRSPENVVDEIEQLVKDFGIEEFNFEDDNLTLNKKRAERIFDLIVERRLKIEWTASNGVRADTLDEGLLKKMKASGCTFIYVAPESGSQKVVDEIVGKKLKLEKVEEAVKLCKKVGIGVGCYFVMGLPGETKEDIEKTIEFGRELRSLGAESCSFFIANPFYGTRLYEISRKNGYIIRNDGEEIEDGFLNLEAMIKTPEFTPEEIYKLREKAVGEQDMGLIVNRVKSISGIKFLLLATIRNPKAALKYLHRMRHSVLKRK